MTYTDTDFPAYNASTFLVPLLKSLSVHLLSPSSLNYTNHLWLTIFTSYFLKLSLVLTFFPRE